MGGFIVLEDGRAYAAANWATDAVIRAVADEVEHPDFATWLLAQQSTEVGMGMTCVDLREVAPIYRDDFYDAVSRSFDRAKQHGFEQLTPESASLRGWLALFDDLVVMIGHWRAGDPPTDFNPHMNGLIAPTGRRSGPGWADAAAL